MTDLQRFFYFEKRYVLNKDEVEKCCSEKNLKLIIFENAPRKNAKI